MKKNNDESAFLGGETEIIEDETSVNPDEIDMGQFCDAETAPPSTAPIAPQSNADMTGARVDATADANADADADVDAALAATAARIIANCRECGHGVAEKLLATIDEMLITTMDLIKTKCDYFRIGTEQENQMYLLNAMEELRTIASRFSTDRASMVRALVNAVCIAPIDEKIGELRMKMK